jgi:DNA mismatch endonuclease (patch repair protein)
MADHLTKEKRSWNMSRIRSKDTRPEKVVRSLLHKMGYRFRLYRNDLPGKPDIVLPKYKTVIFIHGCFWHRHKRCKRCTTPSTNQAYWFKKFERNVAKDKANLNMLKKAGWKIVVVWECWVKNLDRIKAMLEKSIMPKN